MGSAAPLIKQTPKSKSKPGEVFKGCLILLALAFLFLLLLAYGCAKLFSVPSDGSSPINSPTPAQIQGPTPPRSSMAPAKPSAPYLGMPVSTDQLFNAYEQNEVQADQIYKGDLVLVTGRLGSINKDFLDKVYVTLPSRQNEFMGIHAEIADQDRGTAAYLRKGQKIRLSCKGAGKGITDVMLTDCTIH